MSARVRLYTCASKHLHLNIKWCCCWSCSWKGSRARSSGGGFKLRRTLQGDLEGRVCEQCCGWRERQTRSPVWKWTLNRWCCQSVCRTGQRSVRGERRSSVPGGEGAGWAWCWGEDCRRTGEREKHRVIYTSETYTGGLQPIRHCKVLLAENVATLQDGAVEQDNYTWCFLRECWRTRTKAASVSLWIRENRWLAAREEVGNGRETAVRCAVGVTGGWRWGWSPVLSAVVMWTD